MADGTYIATALAVAVAITFALRAAPFALKAALRDSRLVTDIGRWMPLGAVSILAVVLPVVDRRVGSRPWHTGTDGRCRDRGDTLVAPQRGVEHRPRHRSLHRPRELDPARIAARA